MRNWNRDWSGCCCGGLFSNLIQTEALEIVRTLGYQPASADAPNGATPSSPTLAPRAGRPRGDLAVAASAALGKGVHGCQPQRGCVNCIGEIPRAGATALRFNDPIFSCSQGSRATRQPWAVGRSPVGARRAQAL